MPDHIHMLISTPPKHSVPNVVGFMKGKSSIGVAQNISQKVRNFVGHRFWTRGCYISIVGIDKKIIRSYIQNQESEDNRWEQLNLFNRESVLLTPSSDSSSNSHFKVGVVG